MNNTKKMILGLLALVATLAIHAVPAFAQETVEDAPPLWGGSTDSACRSALEGAECGPTAEASRRTFQRIARVCGTEFGSVVQSNGALFAEFQRLWTSCVADTPPPASAAEVPGSVARCGLDGQTPRLRCGGSSDGSPDGQGGGSDSDRRRRTIPFCGPGTRAVQDERGRTRCECIDPRHLIQRVETRWSVPIEVEGLDEARAEARRYDRRHTARTTIVVLGCGMPGPTAQDGLRERLERLEERVTVLERQACYDANGERREDVPQECRDIWRLMSDVITNRVSIEGLRRDLTILESRVHRHDVIEARRCFPDESISDDEAVRRWNDLPPAEAADCGGGDVSALANLLRFNVGVSLLGIARLHMDVTSLYAVVHAQWEPMLTDSIGLYVRFMAGYGSVNDPDGRYGQFAIGESGVIGASGGLAAMLIADGEGADKRSVLTLNAGPAFYSSLVEGRRGRATGTYRWHNLGLEARLRWEPIRHLGIEAMLGITWDRAQVELPGAPLNAQGFPDFVDEDGVGIVFGAGVNIPF